MLSIENPLKKEQQDIFALPFGHSCAVICGSEAWIENQLPKPFLPQITIKYPRLELSRVKIVASRIFFSLQPQALCYNGCWGQWRLLNWRNWPMLDYYISLEGKSNYGRGLTLDDIS